MQTKTPNLWMEVGDLTYGDSDMLLFDGDLQFARGRRALPEEVGRTREERDRGRRWCVNRDERGREL